jgi:hypothetical protein
LAAPVAEALYVTPDGAVTVTDCVAAVLKFSDGVLRVRVPPPVALLPLTVRTTGIVRDKFAAVGALMLIDPLYTPLGRLDRFTWNEANVEVVSVALLSKLNQEVVVEAVKGICEPSLASTWKDVEPRIVPFAPWMLMLPGFV